MRTMVTVTALMVVITAAGITGMVISTGTSTMVIDLEGMAGGIRATAVADMAGTETGSQQGIFL